MPTLCTLLARTMNNRTSATPLREVVPQAGRGAACCTDVHVSGTDVRAGIDRDAVTPLSSAAPGDGLQMPASGLVCGSVEMAETGLGSAARERMDRKNPPISKN
ncbi:MAG: hypothetical protein M3O46_14005 [Myxococcota bacterium]|nr:hypothetical protein [Myxococcota bacterium]